MSRPPRRAYLAAAGLAATALAVSTVAALPATAAGGAAPGTTARAVAPADDTVALDSLRSGFGLTEAQARSRIEGQRHLDAVAHDLARALGNRAAGSWIDQRSGSLVVNVLDARAAATVRAAGAVPHVVTHSLATLDAVKARLDSIAKADRAGHASYWYVDTVSNTVKVTVQAGAHDAATRAFVADAKRAGDAVRIQSTKGTLGTNALYGGEQVEMSNGYICSLGFNAYDSAGRSVFLTAGHCAAGYPWFYRNGASLGGTRGYTFPGNDYGYVNIDNPSYWQPQGAVDMYNGYVRLVYGYSSAAVGSSICKSGRTTGWTCGTIQAYNVTVNYPEGTVYGLVQTNVCTEGGDSGGSWIVGNSAQGLTSGGQSYNGRCGQVYGYPNVAFYQPLGPALSHFGLRLQTW